jgi:hypothetical protein
LFGNTGLFGNKDRPSEVDVNRDVEEILQNGLSGIYRVFEGIFRLFERVPRGNQYNREHVARTFRMSQISILDRYMNDGFLTRQMSSMPPSFLLDQITPRKERHPSHAI